MKRGIIRVNSAKLELWPENSDIYRNISMCANIMGFFGISMHNIMHIAKLCQGFHDGVVLRLPNLNQVIIDDVFMLINPDLTHILSAMVKYLTVHAHFSRNICLYQTILFSESWPDHPITLGSLVAGARLIFCTTAHSFSWWRYLQVLYHPPVPLPS